MYKKKAAENSGESIVIWFHY